MNLTQITFFSLFLTKNTFSVYVKTDLRGDIWPKPQSIVIDRKQVYSISNQGLKINFEDQIYNSKENKAAGYDLYSSKKCKEIFADNQKRYEAIYKTDNFLEWNGLISPNENIFGYDAGENISSEDFKNEWAEA